jgi:hypothetical protein
MHHEYTKSSHLYLRSVRTSLVARIERTTKTLCSLQIRSLESKATKTRTKEANADVTREREAEAVGNLGLQSSGTK